MRAFYFANKDKKLRYEDNRSITVGETHTVDCTPECCSVGLHASVKLIDALKYAPGSMLYLVELSGKLDVVDDKCSATSRTYLAEFDATNLLQEFARKQALINIDKIKPYCTVSEFSLIVDYLTTGRESLRRSAARSAESAARSAESAAR